MFGSVLLFVISPAMGSFLALLADRLPRGEDVIRARSTCRQCKTPLAIRDLVPIASFVLARGRCRHCGAPIPPWLLYTEILAIGCAVMALITGHALGYEPFEIWLSAGLLWVLLALTLTDLIWFRLPDPLTAMLLALALALAWHTGHPGLPLALWGAVIGAGTFWALRWGYRRLRGREGLGLGDVKLMAGLGAALGPFDLPLMLLLASLTALAVALAGRVHSPRALSPTRPLPFGAALAASGAIFWVLLRLPV